MNKFTRKKLRLFFTSIQTLKRPRCELGSVIFMLLLKIFIMALKSFQVKPQTKELNLIATSSCILNTRQDQTCNDDDFTSRNDGSNPPELVVMCFHRRCCCYPAASSLAGVPGERGGGHPSALPPRHHGAQRLPHPAHHQGARGPNQVPRERRRRCRSETKQTGEVQLQL